MEQNQSLKEVLQEQFGLKGLNLIRLQQLTGIPERYLEAIFKGDFHKMPAAPYIRGYIMKIAEALNLNGEELWQHYKKESEVKSSGASDLLPKNRFAIQPIKKGWFIAGLIGFIVIIYLTVNINRLLGQPPLAIYEPSSAISVVNAPIITLSGKINPSDTLKINNQEIPVDSSGKFEKTYTLQPGINNFEFSAKRFLGKETKIIKQVIYQTQ